MSEFRIEVQRCGEWRKVTTVHFVEDSRTRSREANREQGLVEARRQLTGWLAYDGFVGLALRIVEPGRSWDGSDDKVVH